MKGWERARQVAAPRSRYVRIWSRMSWGREVIVVLGLLASGESDHTVSNYCRKLGDPGGYLE